MKFIVTISRILLACGGLLHFAKDERAALRLLSETDFSLFSGGKGRGTPVSSRRRLCLGHGGTLIWYRPTPSAIKRHLCSGFSYAVKPDALVVLLQEHVCGQATSRREFVHELGSS
jgi:hypothetical protein